MMRSGCAVLVVTVLLVVACLGTLSAPRVDAALVANTTTSRIIDSNGRERIFHGTNVVYKGKPYVPVIDHFDYQYSFSEEDVDLLVKWGINAIRLGVMWPGVEPEKGHYNQTYLQILQNITSMCENKGIYVLVDMHQDSWSERFCGEGAPYWAAAPSPDAKPFPEPIDKPYTFNSTTGLPSAGDCEKHSWTTYYFASALGSAVQRMYDNQGGLLDAFSSFWTLVASTFKKHSNLLGYELINEPWAGDVNKRPSLLVPGVADKENLQHTYDQAAKAIRNVDEDNLIFFETVTWDDVVVGFTHPPGGRQYANRSVLAYHFYQPPNLGPRQTIEEHTEAANRLKCGTFCSETSSFDFPATADSLFQSWMHWVYKAFVPKTGYNYGFWHSNGTVDESAVRRLTRTYAMAIAGHGINMTFNEDTAAFSLTFRLNKAISAPTTVYAYEALHYPNGVAVNVLPHVLTWSRSATNYFDFTPNSSAKDGDTVTISITNADKDHHARH